MCVLSHFSRVQLFTTPWTVALQAPLPMGLPRQEHWSGWPFPSQGIFPAQEWNPRLLCLLPWQVSSLPQAPLEKEMATHSVFLPGKSHRDWTEEPGGLQSLGSQRAHTHARRPIPAPTLEKSPQSTTWTSIHKWNKYHNSCHFKSLCFGAVSHKAICDWDNLS